MLRLEVVGGSAIFLSASRREKEGKMKSLARSIPPLCSHPKHRDFNGNSVHSNLALIMLSIGFSKKIFF